MSKALRVMAIAAVGLWVRESRSDSVRSRARREKRDPRA